MTQAQEVVPPKLEASAERPNPQQLPAFLANQRVLAQRIEALEARILRSATEESARVFERLQEARTVLGTQLAQLESKLARLPAPELPAELRVQLEALESQLGSSDADAIESALSSLQSAVESALQSEGQQVRAAVAQLQVELGTQGEAVASVVSLVEALAERSGESGGEAPSEAREQAREERLELREELQSLQTAFRDSDVRSEQGLDGLRQELQVAEAGASETRELLGKLLARVDAMAEAQAEAQKETDARLSALPTAVREALEASWSETKKTVADAVGKLGSLVTGQQRTDGRLQTLELAARKPRPDTAKLSQAADGIAKAVESVNALGGRVDRVAVDVGERFEQALASLHEDVADLAKRSSDRDGALRTLRKTLETLGEAVAAQAAGSEATSEIQERLKSIEEKMEQRGKSWWRG